MALLELDRLTLGRQMRVRRVAVGLPAWQLAARAGMNPARVSEIETDRRPGTAAELERLEAALSEAERAAA